MTNKVLEILEGLHDAQERLAWARHALEEISGAQGTHRVLQNLVHERAAQDSKWGQQNHRMTQWLSILMEEVGEVAKAICETTLQGHPERVHQIREELVQTGAVVVAMIESLDRNTLSKKTIDKESI